MLQSCAFYAFVILSSVDIILFFFNLLKSWKGLVDSGYQTMGSNGALQLRATVGAIASALRRAIKVDRAYPAPSGSSRSNGGGSRNNGNKKGAWIVPPPPRLVGRLKHYAEMQAEAARSRALHAAQW